MERDEYPEPSATLIDHSPVATGEEPSEGGTEDPQLEPTEEELKQARLKEKALKLEEEIRALKQQVLEKEKELGDVKAEMGVTAYTEFKESLAYGWKVVGDKWKELQESEKIRKADETVTGWKQKIGESERYQKTKETLSGWGGKASTAMYKAGTAIKENETIQNIGTRVKTASTRLKESMKKAISTDDDSLADTEEPEAARVSDDEDKDAAAYKDELLIKGDGSED